MTERDEELTETLVVERAEELSSPEFLDVARGEATPLLPMVYRSLGERVRIEPGQKHTPPNAVRGADGPSHRAT